MYAKQPKKMLIINILDILKRYTDENHRLSQSEILRILKERYDMDVNRKSIKPNIMNLIEYGYDINYKEVERRGNEPMLTDFYMNRDFTDEELRILIDSLLFSKYIPYNQCRELVKKLEALSNEYFAYKVRHIRNMPENMPENKELFYTISVLDNAIAKRKKVVFNYCEYGTDKKLHIRAREDGKPADYVVNPYQMVASNGRYYLICNYDKYDNVSNYRIDKIANIRPVNESVKPMKSVKGLEKGLDLPKHMAEHIYMFSGESATVVFRADKKIVSAIIDWFGRDINFFDETEKEVSVSVYVNLNAMKYWIMQYSNYVKVLGPQSLVDTIKADLEEIYNKYKKSESY